MVGEAIKTYLTENGIMQSFLSEKSGIAPSALSKMLAGTQKIEIMDYIHICQALKVSTSKFLPDTTKG